MSKHFDRNRRLPIKLDTTSNGEFEPRPLAAHATPVAGGAARRIPSITAEVDTKIKSFNHVRAKR